MVRLLIALTENLMFMLDRDNSKSRIMLPQHVFICADSFLEDYKV